MSLAAATSLFACGVPGEDLFGGRTSPSEGLGGAGATGGGPAGNGGDPAAEVAASSSSAAEAASVSSSAAQSVASSAQSVGSGGEGGGPPTGVVVYCKSMPCAGGDVCCYSLQDPDLDHCGTAGQCGQEYAEISCAGPNDCPGEICCGTYQQVYTDVSCQPTCNGQSKVVLCTDADDNVCPQNLSCGPSGSLGDGYDVCK